MEKIWKLKKSLKKADFDKYPEVHPIVVQLLFNRGITEQKEIDKFLNTDYVSGLHDPFIFPQMEKAVDRTLKAIENKEKITVYGDYDADGVTSSAVMVETLLALGAKVDIYIPFRETEGYGMNEKAITEIAQGGTKLMITVDNGVSNKKETELAKTKGMDVIITDHHHEPLELPEPFALINPNVSGQNYPFNFLTGVGVAFKFAQGLIARHKNYKVNQLDEGWEKWLLDLVAIGTVADMQPLLDENRVLVKYGLIVLEKTRRLGLLELLVSNKNGKINENTIGWYISPRLNAAGRMNHASTAYELLITKDEAEAKKIVGQLEETNKQRQITTERIIAEAIGILGETKNKKFLVAVGDNWPTGVVGLVAGRIADRTKTPTFIISRFNGQLIGSGRSVPEFNIIEAVEKCDKYLVRYGGHAQATGFTVKEENLDDFINGMTKLAEKALAKGKTQPTLEIDCQVELEKVDWNLFEDLEKFEPYGEGNPRPRFLARDLTVTAAEIMGKEGKHLRLLVQHSSEVVRKTVGFGFGHWSDKIKIGDKIDMVFEVDINEWNGNRELQLKIIDLKKTNE